MDKQTRKFVPKSARLMDQVREVLRFHHYAYNTEKSYVSWILQYIRFHYKKHPKDMAKPEVEAFISHLAINRNVSASTRNQAFNAIVFLYRQVLGIDFDLDILASSARTKDVKTTEIYTHVMSTQLDGVINPLDTLLDRSEPVLHQRRPD